MKESKYFDIVFLYSGNPLPAMLDLAYYAHNSGLKVCVIILERGRGDLIIDSSLVNYELKVINVNYKSVSLSRFLTIPLIYATLSKYIKNNLKKGGILILEGFEKKHIEYNSKNEKAGGPKDVNFLFSKEELLQDFEDLEIISIEEKTIELREGAFHCGESAVIRLIGRKK